MEQKYKIIKGTKEFCFKQIEEANKTLKEIREQCDHPKEYYEKVNYSTRPGQIFPNTTICGICGEVVEWPSWESCLDPSLYEND
jgi:hypothetical protein